jgi:hypothetical protein
VPLGASQLGIVLLLGVLPFTLVEAGKAIFRAAGWTLAPRDAAR